VGFISKVLTFYVRRLGSASNRYDVQRLQSVTALKRVHDDLRSMPGSEIEYIAKIFRETKLTRNFLFTVEACLRHRETQDIAGFLLEVEAAFPGMIEEMKALLRERLVCGKAVPTEHGLFLQSPTLWWEVVRKSRSTPLQEAN
jgi:hypothetical protein